MLQAFIAAIIILAVLMLSEQLRQRRVLRGELSRKFVHITNGTFIAFLPLWVPYRWIAVLAVGFIIVNVFNHLLVHFDMPRAGKLAVFTGARTIQSVQRKTLGDVLFALAVLACAVAQPDWWIFAAAILQVALADGFAAVAGVTFGAWHGYRYTIFGYKKTIVGTLTFMTVSFIVLAVLLSASHSLVASGYLLLLMVCLAIILTGIENLGVYGLDNILLPVVTVALLGRLVLV